VHDLVSQRQLNPEQPMVALIQLTFELRGEIWLDGQQNKTNLPEESHFHSTRFSELHDWRPRLLQGKDIIPKKFDKFGTTISTLDKKFLRKHLEAMAYFYSPYAERINLLNDLIMLRALLDSLNIKFLIFQGPKAETLESEYLLDFFKNQLYNDNRIFDLEQFGFTNWADENNFDTLDDEDRSIGHYGPAAHEAFATNILLPKLETL
jgi:hypothetical protein